jgi:hypothetical protein
MAGGPSERVLGQVHRLFELGAVGTMSDAQLLEWFIAPRDEAGFEELVIRHAPMVSRVCRGVLGVVVIPEDAAADALDHRAVAMDQRPGRLAIAVVHEPSKQLPVGLGPVHAPIEQGLDLTGHRAHTAAHRRMRPR